MCSVPQSCPTLCDPMDCSPPGSSTDFSGKNTGVACHFLLQGIFPTQGSNLRVLSLLHCRQILLSLSHLECPRGQWTWAKISLQAGTFHPRLQRPLLCFTTTRLQTTFQIKLKEQQGVLVSPRKGRAHSLSLPSPVISTPLHRVGFRPN